MSELEKVPSEVPPLFRGTRIKFGTDGKYVVSDGSPLPEKLLVVAMLRGAQHWQGGELLQEIVEAPGTALPDVEAENEKIPQDKWDAGFGGQGKRKPWTKVYAVHLLDLRDAGVFCLLNSTAGQASGYRILKDKIEMMRALCGEHVRPIVRLESRTMPTDFGPKPRPEFVVVAWLSPDGTTQHGALAGVQGPRPKLLKQIAPPTTEQILSDRVPF